MVKKASIKIVVKIKAPSLVPTSQTTALTLEAVVIWIRILSDSTRKEAKDRIKKKVQVKRLIRWYFIQPQRRLKASSAAAPKLLLSYKKRLIRLTSLKRHK